MAKGSSVKPTHKAVKTYHAALEAYADEAAEDTFEARLYQGGKLDMIACTHDVGIFQGRNGTS